MLKSREELIRLRQECIKASQKEKRKLLVCTGTGCVSSGSMEIYERLCQLMAERNLPFAVEMMGDAHDDAMRFTKGGCSGFCELGPLIRVQPQGWLYTRVALSRLRGNHRADHC